MKQKFLLFLGIALLGISTLTFGQSNRLKNLIRKDSLEHEKWKQEHQKIANYHLEETDLDLFRSIADSITIESEGVGHGARHRKEKLKNFFKILHRDLVELNSLWQSTNKQLAKLNYHQTFLLEHIHENPIYSAQEYKKLQETLKFNEHKKQYWQSRKNLARAEFKMITRAWKTYGLFNININKRLVYSELFACINGGFEDLKKELEKELEKKLEEIDSLNIQVSTQEDSLNQLNLNYSSQKEEFERQKKDIEKQEKKIKELLLDQIDLSASLKKREAMLLNKDSLLQLRNKDLKEIREQLGILNHKKEESEKESGRLDAKVEELKERICLLEMDEVGLLIELECESSNLMAIQEDFEAKQKNTHSWLIALIICSIAGIILLIISVIRLYRNKCKISKAYQELQKIKNQLQVRTTQLRLSQRELNHRVKNNLQLISSLIYLQEDEIEDEEARGVFSALQGRIDTIKIVHQKLYAKKNQALTIVNIAEYIADLVKYIVGGEAEVNLDIPNVFVEMDHATDVGLIVNELVTNACKYAFPYVENPQLDIRIRTRYNFIDMLVRDNGPGFPLDFSMSTTSTFGLKSIVEMFVHKSGRGCLSTYNNNGGIVEIGMPLAIK